MYAVVFGQYSEAMRAKIEGKKRFGTIKQDSNVAALLCLMRDIAFDIKADKNPFVAQVLAIKNFINIKQGLNTPNGAYYD